MKRIPKTKEDFAWVNWTAVDIEKLPEELLARKRERYISIKSISATERTFENTVYGLESAGNLIQEFNLIEILMQASPIEDVRKAAEKAIKKIQEDLVDLEYDPDVYRALKEFAVTIEAKTLAGEDKKLFEDTIRTYRRMGFELPKDKQEELKSILKKLQKLQTEFMLNINNYKDNILATTEELQGLPENYIKNLGKDEVSGKYIVSIKTHEMVQFMENASDANKRKELSDKTLHKGGDKNISILKEILSLRKHYTEMLGYATYVDYAVELRMAKSEKTVKTFLDDLFSKIESLKNDDLKVLLNTKRSMTGDQNAILEYFDVAYYINQSEKNMFYFDKEKVREYFPLETVLAGLFQVFETIFSIYLEETSEYPVWHPDVRLYAVKDKSQEIIGYFFTDLHPRDNKYSHPSMWPLINGHRDGYKSPNYVTPVATLMGNFSKSTPETPSLLSHDEVATLFHEFGHILHGLLTTASYASQSGTAVAWDFVEVPSQMLEHWVWDKEILNILSGHYKNSNEKLPSEIVDNMLKAKNHMVGYTTTRQLVLATYNHILHAGSVPENITKVYNDLNFKHVGVRLPEDNIFAAGFGHLIGYAGAYYSYLWSNVYECDLFTRFKKDGLLNPVLGKEYRDKVLAVGSSRDEMETVKDFLGREPNNESFLEEIGLIIRRT